MEERTLAKGDKAVAKVMLKAKTPMRGRPAKYVGECRRCRYIAEGVDGGPAHDRSKCAYTKAKIRREKMESEQLDPGSRTAFENIRALSLH